MSLIVHDGQSIPEFPVPHDPDDLLDYPLVLDDWLGSDTIKAVGGASVVAEAGITVENVLVNAVAVTVEGKSRKAYSVATAWISAAGATPGQSYLMTYTIATDGGRQKDFTVRLTVQNSDEL